MIKNLFLFSLLLVFSGYLVYQLQTPNFKKLSAEERLQRVIRERDEAIKLAVEEGVYQCCIEPPCTMCYLEANQWNHYQAGTCACDELIARGEEPCPQCKQGLCETDDEGVCETKGGE